MALFWLAVVWTTAAFADSDARFFVKRIVVWENATEVIPLGVADAPTVDATFAASSDDPSIVNVIRTPSVLAGEKIGFLRVKGMRAGHTQLHLHPGDSLEVDVKPDPAATALSTIDPDHSLVRIVSPMPGASVFGRFGVAVELFDSPVTMQSADSFASGQSAPAPPPTRRVQLRLPDGQLLDPIAETSHESSPQRQYTFSVAADDLPLGGCKLVAVATPSDLSEVDVRAGRFTTQLSDPLPLVTIATPLPEAVLTGECEDQQSPLKEANAPSRPARFGTKQPRAIPDPDASGLKTLAITNSSDAWCMPLVVKQPGEYEMFIRARGQTAFGVYPTVGVFINDSEHPAGLVRLAGPKYHRIPVGGPFELSAGPQVISVAFRNDLNIGKEDRNLFLDRYELVRVGEAPKPAPTNKPAAALAQAPAHPAAAATPAPADDLHVVPSPKLTLLYPANGANVFGADAVVARFTAAEPLAYVDLLVDGQPQNLRQGKPKPNEALLFPLLLRDLSPGAHRIAVRAGSQSGADTDSAEQMINVLAQAPARLGPYDRALKLLNRLAFGAEPSEVAAILTLGEAPWLNNRLASSFDTPAELATLADACRKFPNGDDPSQTSTRALEQWLASDNPVRSRFTAWTENHFTTWIKKVKAGQKWSEHYDFCRLGIAPFGDLLDASAHSPAMISYLDQAKSYASKLNENYAREIMELHTLGVHGGYSQADVTALASVLNGWTVSSEALLPNRATELLTFKQMGGEQGMLDDFLFAPALNDGKPRRVFGLQFPAADVSARYDRVRLAIEMLSSHPRTADHVCRKLAESYVADPAPDRLVATMARAFMESGGDMRAVLRTMVSQPDFWQAPARLSTPLDLALRMGRLCRAGAIEAGANPYEAARPDAAESFLQRSGMGLFDHVSPDGYPDNDAAYADSNAMLQRWRYCQTLNSSLNRLVPEVWRQPPSPNGGPLPANTAQRFIDLASIRLTGRLLSPDSNKSALDVVGDPTAANLRETMVFVSLLPETNLR